MARKPKTPSGNVTPRIEPSPEAIAQFIEQTNAYWRLRDWIDTPSPADPNEPDAANEIMEPATAGSQFNTDDGTALRLELYRDAKAGQARALLIETGRELAKKLPTQEQIRLQDWLSGIEKHNTTLAAARTVWDTLRIDLRLLAKQMDSKTSKGVAIDTQLDEPRLRIRIGGKWHKITEAQKSMLSILFEAEGGWVQGKIIGGRADQTRRRMSKAVHDIIESHPVNGYRIPSLSPQ